MKTDLASTKRRTRTLATRRGHIPGPFVYAPGATCAIALCLTCGGELLAFTDGQTSVPRLCRIT